MLSTYIQVLKYLNHFSFIDHHKFHHCDCLYPETSMRLRLAGRDQEAEPQAAASQMGL